MVATETIKQKQKLSGAGPGWTADLVAEGRGPQGGTRARPACNALWSVPHSRLGSVGICGPGSRRAAWSPPCLRGRCLIPEGGKQLVIRGGARVFCPDPSTVQRRTEVPCSSLHDVFLHCSNTQK